MFNSQPGGEPCRQRVSCFHTDQTNPEFTQCVRTVFCFEAAFQQYRQFEKNMIYDKNIDRIKST